MDKEWLGAHVEHAEAVKPGLRLFDQEIILNAEVETWPTVNCLICKFRWLLLLLLIVLSLPLEFAFAGHVVGSFV